MPKIVAKISMASKMAAKCNNHTDFAEKDVIFSYFESVSLTDIVFSYFDEIKAYWIEKYESKMAPRMAAIVRLDWTVFWFVAKDVAKYALFLVLQWSWL